MRGAAEVRRLLSTDMMSGLFMLAVGLGGTMAVGSAEIGVINDMGTGYLPRLIAFAIMGGRCGLLRARLRASARRYASALHEAACRYLAVGRCVCLGC